MSKACTECNCIKANGVDFFCEVASVCVPDEVALDPEGECQYFKQRTEPAPFEVVTLRECLKINPDNPQAVAEGIGEMYEALKEIEEQFGYCLPDPYISRVRKALGKEEGGEG